MNGCIYKSDPITPEKADEPPGGDNLNVGLSPTH